MPYTYIFVSVGDDNIERVDRPKMKDNLTTRDLKYGRSNY